MPGKLVKTGLGLGAVLGLGVGGCNAWDSSNQETEPRPPDTTEGQGAGTEAPATTQAPATVEISPPTAINFALANVACQLLLSTVITPEDGGSPLRAMAKASGNQEYTEIMPPARAEAFAKDALNNSGVPFVNIGDLPDGTAFSFGVNCTDLATGQPFPN